MAEAPRKLAYRGNRDFVSWRDQLVSKTTELLCCPSTRCDLDLRIAFERMHKGFLERRFTFAAEPDATVPCHLLLPESGDGPFPVMVCLQGHNTGMHISLGRPRFDGDEHLIAGDRDFALQAVRQGFAALAVEQRCFGERKDQRSEGQERYADHAPKDENRSCKHAAMTALLVGRTLLGERVFDLRRVCDVIETFDELDQSRIHCIGHSGGGTVIWYAAAIEPRIRGIIVSSCFATVQSSTGTVDHCTDNYLPGMLEWFDFADLAGAIAPRKALVVMGKYDHLFPYEGVSRAFEHASQIYAAAGAPDALQLVIGEEGHRFYAEPAWQIFREMVA